MIRWLTTPLLPDDFAELVSPLWSRTAPRGRVIAVRQETERARTLRIRPGRGWAPARRTIKAGQFARIGVDIDGVRHWRSYSLTSTPDAPYLEITVQAQPDGRVSGHLVHRTEVGDLLNLGAPPAGEFVLPNPVPDRLLMITAGSGITPVMAMLRTLAGRMPDVVLLHSAPRPEDVIFRAELAELARRNPTLRVTLRHTATDGRLDLAELDRLCPDWADRAAFVCGPAGLRDAALAHWEPIPDRLRTEGFTPPPRVSGGAGGRVRFGSSVCPERQLAGTNSPTRADQNADSREVHVEGGVSLLEAGEGAGVVMPSGCRMGICFGCLVRLEDGQVRDLRTGRVFGEPGELIQTCINGAAGPAVLDIEREKR